jgi:hypothetical protein
LNDRRMDGWLVGSGSAGDDDKRYVNREEEKRRRKHVSLIKVRKKEFKSVRQREVTSS